MTDQTTTHPSYSPAAGGALVQIVADAIERSISHTEIMVLGHSDDLARALLAEADGDVEVNGVHEFWGCRDGDGVEEWRIHLI